MMRYGRELGLALVSGVAIWQLVQLTQKKERIKELEKLQLKGEFNQQRVSRDLQIPKTEELKTQTQKTEKERVIESSKMFKNSAVKDDDIIEKLNQNPSDIKRVLFMGGSTILKYAMVTERSKVIEYCLNERVPFSWSTTLHGGWLPGATIKSLLSHPLVPPLNCTDALVGAAMSGNLDQFTIVLDAFYAATKENKSLLRDSVSRCLAWAEYLKLPCLSDMRALVKKMISEDEIRPTIESLKRQQEECAAVIVFHDYQSGVCNYDLYWRGRLFDTVDWDHSYERNDCWHRYRPEIYRNQKASMTFSCDFKNENESLENSVNLLKGGTFKDHKYYTVHVTSGILPEFIYSKTTGTPNFKLWDAINMVLVDGGIVECSHPLGGATLSEKNDLANDLCRALNSRYQDDYYVLQFGNGVSPFRLTKQKRII